MHSKENNLVHEFIENNFPDDVKNISPIQGDASNRKYFRIQHQKQTVNSSIAMVHEEPFDEEKLPFLRILKYFKQLNIPVPEIYKCDPFSGIILLEDCGNDLLEKFVIQNHYKVEDYYNESVHLISKLQSNDETYKIKKISLESFSDDFFFAELKHTEKFAFNKLLGIKTNKEKLHEFFFCLSSSISKIPFSLTHRDYHSRNLIFKGGSELIMLDFQDARKGPLTYDLASLIYDSYASITDELKIKLSEEFWILRGRAFFKSKEEFLNALFETALQRNIKAIGTFAFQRTEKDNPRYLSYIPNTVKFVRNHFNNLKRYEKFFHVMEPFLDKLENLNKEIIN
tara:strand:- start:202 stop:1224 length:1023 start_codon:yes stop_codon:yes gene_type:complete